MPGGRPADFNGAKFKSRLGLASNWLRVPALPSTPTVFHRGKIHYNQIKLRGNWKCCKQLHIERARRYTGAKSFDDV